MLAIINLFIHILEYPLLKTTQSDIALLDIGAGHFGQIHHLTSGHISFQFPRQVSVLACKAVERAQANAANNLSSRGTESGAEEVLYDPSDVNVSAVFTQFN